MRARRWTPFITAICMLTWGSALAAGPGGAAGSRDVAAQAQAMKKLAFMEGRWSGEASSTLPDGSTKVSRSEDDIDLLLNGTVLVIRGRSYAGVAGDARLIGENLGLLSFDERTAQYELRSYARGAVMVGKVLAVEEGAARWQLESDGAQYRFDVRARGADEWHEAVDRSTDGGRTWTPFVNIQFKRKR